MIAMLFYALCGFAALHFIYERIILPSMRLKFRNELFRIRDTVRNEIISGDLGKDLVAANLIHDGLNNTINRLHLLTIGNKVRAQIKFERDPAMRDRVKRNSEVLITCKNSVLTEAIKDSVSIMDSALIWNNLLFIIYVSPVVLVMMLGGLVLKTLNHTMQLFKSRIKAKEFEESILLMNDNFMNRVVYAH
ncbi:hypothetical protein ACPX3P_000191 [Yersinia enterocolitica]|nr:hypothetical protein [Yersinia enterocolitica]ELI8151257.1 hypothetical protein [Yersinia enterocolitica]HDL6946933.1 hypothetical protein [Yersinia enterocolitica]